MRSIVKIPLSTRYICVHSTRVIKFDYFEFSKIITDSGIGTSKKMKMHEFCHWSYCVHCVDVLMQFTYLWCDKLNLQAALSHSRVVVICDKKYEHRSTCSTWTS